MCNKECKQCQKDGSLFKPNIGSEKCTMCPKENKDCPIMLGFEECDIMIHPDVLKGYERARDDQESYKEWD